MTRNVRRCNITVSNSFRRKEIYQWIKLAGITGSHISFLYVQCTVHCSSQIKDAKTSGKAVPAISHFVPLSSIHSSTQSSLFKSDRSQIKDAGK